MKNIRTHPAFRQEQKVVPLSGFSGAYVGLLEQTGSIGKRVRKAAVLPEDSPRLQMQAKLQSSLAAALSGTAQVPAILNEGFLEDCYWYDMEFVAGLDAIEYLSTATRQKADSFVHQIAMILAVQAGTRAPDNQPINLKACFAGKLQEIDARTRGAFKTWTALIQAALGEDQILLEPNLAHGDLTLENILVDGQGNLWLIDTIPSPFNHYWIDLAKLYQDLAGRWFMHRGRSLSIGVTRTVSDKIMQQANKLDPRYKRYHPALLGLTFARILPYCKTDGDTQFVISRIELALQMAAENQETRL